MVFRMVARVLALVFVLFAFGARAEDARLFTDCRGDKTAAPTVILEAGAFGTSADWDYVLRDLSDGGRVCAYDRAGLGRSRGVTGSKDPVSRGRQLGDLLTQMGETGPVILVGHSNGALYIEAFARLFPRRTAGLVYINGVTSEDLDSPVLLHDLAKEARLANFAAGLERLGLAPFTAPILVDEMRLHGDAASRKYHSLTCRACVRAARDEDRLVIPGLAAVRELGGDIAGIPVAVVSTDTNPHSELASAFHQAELAPAQRAKYGWILDAPGGSHISPLARDRAYVVAAVNWLRAAYAGLPDPGVGH